MLRPRHTYRSNRQRAVSLSRIKGAPTEYSFIVSQNIAANDHANTDPVTTLRAIANAAKLGLVYLLVKRFRPVIL
ncbi:hypothetical protein ACH79_39600 [Bradyrhizobium sp. CCBAU 051011]|nr:hypothetical protein ACH79_39600 [Bradyrhizobium sp. CCBAU 051011]